MGGVHWPRDSSVCHMRNLSAPTGQLLLLLLLLLHLSSNCCHCPACGIMMMLRCLPSHDPCTCPPVWGWYRSRLHHLS